MRAMLGRTKVRRPRIGLALGSGAGRGWAHIGVVRALARAGIDADVVCGTSIGALVGGVYLAGHLDTLEDWARSLNKLKLLRYLDVKIGGGFIGGKRLMAVIRDNIGEITVESLGKPYAAVAAELPSGHEVWLRDGPLIDAMSASFALPGVFPPVKRDNHWLVDGALVNPVPVSVCRALGARLVIAVNLNADVLGKRRKTPTAEEEPAFEGLDPLPLDRVGGDTHPARRILRKLSGENPQDPKQPSAFGVMVSSLQVLQDRLSRARLAGDPPDVTVAPRIGHIGLMEFDKADELITEGEEAVERALPFLTEALQVLA
jgi:NTE family protein